MAAIEAVIIDKIKGVATDLVKQGYVKLMKNDSNEYIQELYEIIISTIQEYEQRFPITETDKIPFYKSQILIDAFLKFRFTKVLNKEVVKKTIESDIRLIPPTEQELSNFLEIFTTKVLASEALISLDINVNFKEEIFNITYFLKSFRDTFTDSINEIKVAIKSKQISLQLLNEWNLQLDEILENVKKFKAFTAKERLENLEKRIVEESINDDKLFARLYNLKSECLNQIGESEIKEEHGRLLIKIYKLQPSNQIYKANAAYAYFALGEVAKAGKLADELVEYDEFNIVGWVIKCCIANDHFKEVLANVPTSVLNTYNFKILIYRWLLQNHFVKNIEEMGRT